MSILTPHQSKALDIDRSISLTANAGSGKTFVLSQRFIEILLTTDTRLNQVAAITFTEKAAGELFKRISDELDNVALTVSNNELREKIKKLKKHLVSAKISTIHSFCIDLLKEFPVEASIDANFIPINEQKASELIDLSVEYTLKELVRDSEIHQDVKSLVRLLGSRTRLAGELASMIKKRKNILTLIEKYYSSGEAETAKLLFKLFENTFQILFTEILPEVISQISTINKKVLETSRGNEKALEVKSMLEKIKSENNVVENILDLKRINDLILTTGGTIRTQGYASSGIRNELSEAITYTENFFNDFSEIEIDNNYQKLNKELARNIFALIRILDNVYAEYERKKSELGVLDFEDILLKTNNLFKNKAVANALSKKYKYLLVDEYQDTNEIQYEIFLPLVDQLKSGNLFIVGDEKQSIYRFRDAELQVFSKTKTDIQKLNGSESLLTLPDSFRMAPALCSFINSLFKDLFSNPNLFFNEVSATDLVCARNDSFPGKVEFLISSLENVSEAELVSKRILLLKNEYQDRLKNWADIAVLVRKRASFTELQKTFTKYQIPFNLIGGTGFYQKQSISDIYNYFSFLLNDKNDAALIGSLRSPFFLVPDSNILKLSAAKGESFWEKLKSSAKSNEEAWARIFNSLDKHKSLSKRIGIPQLLRKILGESNFISILSSRIDGQQEISNLNKLVSFTNNFFDNEFNTLYDYVTFLHNAITGIEDESQAQIKAGSDGVNILTIHQAKGLEYKAVFLFGCNETTQVNKVKSRSFIVDKEFGILTKVPVNENYFGEYRLAPIAGVYNLVESKKENAELKRLLYVALTRAKDFLFISQADEGKSVRKNSFASLINEGLQQDLKNEQIVLEGKLSYLVKDKDSYSEKEKAIKIEVPITRNLDAGAGLLQFPNLDSRKRKITLSKIKDHSKGEVISATRFSTFIRCPLKYNFIYNYKLGELLQHVPQDQKKFGLRELEDYNRKELSSYLFDDEARLSELSKLKGQVIHYLLRKYNNFNDVISYFDQKSRNNFNREISDSLMEEIKNELNVFYSSSEYDFIKSFPNFRNEFEAYIKKEDYYLFGILDKLIIDEKKLIIVDFKTDDINSNEISSKAAKYLPQLKFYAYIISRLFSKKYSIEGRVIFTKHPESQVTFLYDKSSDEEIKSGIRKMIQSIRSDEYSVNLSECSNCIFADKNSNCIKVFHN